MKKGQAYEGVVSYLEFPNKGVILTEEGKAVVKNTIPGQKISFVVTKKRKGKVEGRCESVLSKSPMETESHCPHFGQCGGCTYQTLPYDEQLKIKEEQVKSLLTAVYKNRNEDADFLFEGIKASPTQFEYRNKMEFSFGDEYLNGPLALGMHKRGSFYDIVNVADCQIVDEDYRLILKATLDYFTEQKACFYHKMRHVGFLRHLLVRKAKRTGEILIALVTSTQDMVPLEGYVERLLELQKEDENGKRKLTGTIAGILHTKNDSLADVVKSDETEILYGQDYFFEEVLGLKFKITQFSFFQTNSLGAEVLYDTARQYVGSLCEDGKPDKVVFDLYSGTGTIAQLLAPVAKEVIGVEIVEEAVEAAKKNAELNGLHNCKFIAGDVLKVIDEIDKKPDMIVLDPPRDGIHPKALKKIIDYGVERIVYISCKPTSLARDLDAFLERGYRMERVCLVDMFPGTSGIETIVLLGRKQVHDYIYVDYEPKDEDYLKDCKHKATYGDISDWVKKEYGLHVSNLYIAQVKRKLGFDMMENYNKGVEGHRVPNCPKEKEEAIMAALKHFGVIE